MKLIRRTAAGLLLVAVLTHAAFLILDAAFPFPDDRLHPPAAGLVLDQDGHPLRFFLPGDDTWRLPVALEEVSPVLVKALLTSEDRWFRYHPGVNPGAIVRAAFTNLAAGRVVCGGSTLPMQLARLTEPKPRILSAKIVEAFRALQLSNHHSKNDLLERYLNLAPFGGNIVGVRAASWFYFGKSPDRLSLGEAALLTALPRAPSAYDPIRHPEAARAARNRVLRQVAHRFPDNMVAQALAEPLPTSLTRSPMIAPHFAEAVRSRLPGPVARTSLDRDIQQTVAELARAHAPSLHAQGLDSTAVVVLDRDTREVLAMVGSPDFFDSQRAGQVNAALAPRSPGSTLKPFLFALAMDKGLIVPQSLLFDIPTDFAGYAPENFDGRYRGPVTAGFALSHSLNVPAVRLLGRTGMEDFHGLLKAGGLTTLDKAPHHYGLSLILGGGEATLLDLTNLYATLGSGGRHRPPSFVPANAPEPGTPLLSPEACKLVTDILAEVERPDMPRSWQLSRTAPEVAWKTGTSFGHRDAWAVGYSDRLAVGVWVGNPDGRSREGISGARHAGPLLFEIFRALEPRGSRLPDSGPLNLTEINLDGASRMLPGPYATDTVKAVVIPGVTKLARDRWTRRIFVDLETGERLTGDCLAKRPHRAVVVTEYPVELAAWRRAQGLPVAEMPPICADCEIAQSRGAPVIISPDPNTPYRLRADAPVEYQRIPLRANAAGGELFWFSDGLLVASGPPDASLFIAPVRGEHELVVQDGQGRSDTVIFRVE